MRETLIRCLPYTLQPGITPTTFRCTGWHSNRLSHPARAVSVILTSKSCIWFFSNLFISCSYFQAFSLNIAHSCAIFPYPFFELSFCPSTVFAVSHSRCFVSRYVHACVTVGILQRRFAFASVPYLRKLQNFDLCV